MELSNMEAQADKRSVVLRVAGRFKTMILATIVGAVFAALLYYLVVEVLPGEPPYTAESTLYIEFEPEYLEANQYFNAYTWRQIAKSTAVIDLVMPFLPEDYTRQEMIDAIWVELKADVRVMTLQIESESEERATVMMNAMVQGLGLFGEKQRELSRIFEIDAIEATRNPRNLLTERAAGLGAVCGLLLSLAVLFVQEIMKTAIFVPEECRSRYGIPAQAVFTQKGTPWRENEWALSKEPVKTGILIGINEQELQQAQHLTGAKKGYVYASLKPEEVVALQGRKDVFLAVTWGKTAGAEVRHIAAECDKAGIVLAGIILTDADEVFLNRYYKG